MVADGDWLPAWMCRPITTRSAAEEVGVNRAWVDTSCCDDLPRRYRLLNSSIAVCLPLLLSLLINIICVTDIHFYAVTPPLALCKAHTPPPTPSPIISLKNIQMISPISFLQHLALLVASLRAVFYSSCHFRFYFLLTHPGFMTSILHVWIAEEFHHPSSTSHQQHQPSVVYFTETLFRWKGPPIFFSFPHSVWNIRESLTPLFFHSPINE